MSLTQQIVDTNFTGVTVISDERSRVAITSCRICGAAVVMSHHDIRDGFDALEVHLEYHARRGETV